jgi:high-affinity nickel-transport protein
MLSDLVSGKINANLPRGTKIKLTTMYSLIVVATIIGFTGSVIVGRLSLLLAGLGVVSYVLGLRHAVDADHIAAIDNTTRKLLQEKKHPFTVGLWFSLGHSTILFCLIVAFIFATRTVVGHIPALTSSGNIIGTAISGGFLWVIGIVNAIIVLSIYRMFKEMRGGKINPDELEKQMDERSFMNRYFRPLFKIIREPWQIYPVGVLFGLGFDTVTQITMIAISVGIGVSSSVPVWMILVLPFMFTCGMVLVDTTDGVTMGAAYGWAFSNPLRKIYYNLTITVISVVVALAIGTIELLQVIGDELNLNGLFWGWLENMDFETIGYAIISMFLVSWLVAWAIWKFKRFDKRPILFGGTNDSTSTIRNSSQRGSEPL